MPERTPLPSGDADQILLTKREADANGTADAFGAVVARAVKAKCRSAVGRCGLERALGAALASEPNGVGELATRVVWCPCRGAVVKSPRLALERLQCNNSATFMARSARGKEWEASGLESAGREGGVVATVSMAGRVLCWGCCGVVGNVATTHRRGRAGVGGFSLRRGARSWQRGDAVVSGHGVRAYLRQACGV